MRKSGYKHSEKTKEKMRKTFWSTHVRKSENFCKCGKKISQLAKSCKSCCKIGKKFSLEHKKKIALAKSGNKNPAKQQWVKDKIRNTLKNKWKDPIFVKNLNKRKSGKINIPEKKLQKFLKYLFNKDYKYVGDGKYWIVRFNPDFVNKDKKLIIELFGDYWHNRKGMKERDALRIKIFKKYNYKTLVIWEHELDNINKLLFKLNKWHNKYNYKFYQNVECKYFPCHKKVELKNFSCMMCYCPLYTYECEGYFIMRDGKKDCSYCTIPHVDYDYVINFLKNFIYK
jgi:Zn-finger protein